MKESANAIGLKEEKMNSLSKKEKKCKLSEEGYKSLIESSNRVKKELTICESNQ